MAGSINFKMSTHKHRKGFRADQVMLSEAYSSVYNEEDIESYRSKTIMNDDPDFFDWHNKKKEFLGKRGDIVTDSVTGDKGVLVNVRDYDVDLRNGEREWTAKIKDLVLDEEEEAGDDEIDLTVKDPSKAYEDLEGGEGKYL